METGLTIKGQCKQSPQIIKLHSKSSLRKKKKKRNNAKDDRPHKTREICANVHSMRESLPVQSRTTKNHRGIRDCRPGTVRRQAGEGVGGRNGT